MASYKGQNLQSPFYNLNFKPNKILQIKLKFNEKYSTIILILKQNNPILKNYGMRCRQKYFVPFQISSEKCGSIKVCRTWQDPNLYSNIRLGLKAAT